MSFLYPAAPGFAKTEIKASRFIGQLFHVASRFQDEDKIKQVQTEYKDASHNCFAYRVFNADGSEYSRMSDEGEPSGTAGKPIYESLLENNIGEALLIVTRYFGGTKLGTGGLIRAYRGCARLTIDDASLEEKIEIICYILNFDYQYEPAVKSYLYRLNCSIYSSKYGKQVEYSVSMPFDNCELVLKMVKDICRGQVEYKLVQEETETGF